MLQKKFTPFWLKRLLEHAPSYATVINWVAQFNHGDSSTCDEPRPGRQKIVTTPEIIDQIHEVNFETRRISAKSIAEQLGISRERVGSVVASLVWWLNSGTLVVTERLVPEGNTFKLVLDT